MQLAHPLHRKEIGEWMKVAEPDVTNNGVTILNIDDNEPCRYLKSRLLRSQGYTVIEGLTGSDALRLARDTKPQLALLDVKLPDINGLEVCRALKSNVYTKSVMVLLVSALATRSEDKVAGLEDGADGYLVEPADPNEMLAMVRALLRLYRQEQTLSTQARLLDMSKDTILMRDEQDRIIYWNHGAESLYGWSREEALGKISHTLLKTEFPEPLEEINSTFNCVGRWLGELVHFTRNGERMIVDSHWSRNCEPDGTYGTVLEINTDITARKRREEELRLSETRLRVLAGEQENMLGERTRELMQSQSRLRALAMELSLAEQHERENLARDLHDYLGQLLALSQIKLDMARKQPMGNPLATIFAEVRQSTSQALEYTRSLVSQLYPPVLKQFGLAAALQWLAEQLRLSEFRVTVQVGTQISPLPDDQARFLFQSIRELLHNCQKYSRVSEATIVIEKSEKMLCITVSDQGIGFNADSVMDKDEVTTKGFGLFSVRERIFSLGGQFSLKTAPGKGTEVKLALPIDNSSRELRNETSISSDTETRKANGVVGSKLRIIVADDHVMVREGICGVLGTHKDIEVVGEAGNGGEAIELANRLQPDVVVMDVSMPKVDGLEATRRIKEKYPSMVVVGISVNNSPTIEAEMRKAGASAFFNKEAAVGKLYEAVSAVRLQEKPGIA